MLDGECILPGDSGDLSMQFYDPDFELTADDFIYVPDIIVVPERRPNFDESFSAEAVDPAATEQLQMWDPKHCDQRLQTSPPIVSGWMKGTWPICVYNPIEPKFIARMRRSLQNPCY